MSARVKKVANAEVRAAKKFAKLAKNLDKSFSETLRILARRLSGGQV